MKRVLRFGSVGVLNTVVDFSVFNMLVIVLGVSAVPANVVSNIAGIVNSYVWNRAWTFADIAHERSTASSFPRFVISSLIGLAINTGSLWALLQVLGPWVTSTGPEGSLIRTAAINALKIAAAVLSLTWNFLAYRYWAFARPQR